MEVPVGSQDVGSALKPFTWLKERGGVVWDWSADLKQLHRHAEKFYQSMGLYAEIQDVRDIHLAQMSLEEETTFRIGKEFSDLKLLGLWMKKLPQGFALHVPTIWANQPTRIKNYEDGTTPDLSILCGQSDPQLTLASGPVDVWTSATAGTFWWTCHSMTDGHGPYAYNFQLGNDGDMLCFKIPGTCIRQSGSELMGRESWKFEPGRWEARTSIPGVMSQIMSGIRSLIT